VHETCTLRTARCSDQKPVAIDCDGGAEASHSDRIRGDEARDFTPLIGRALQDVGGSHAVTLPWGADHCRHAIDGDCRAEPVTCRAIHRLEALPVLPRSTRASSEGMHDAGAFPEPGGAANQKRGPLDRQGAPESIPSGGVWRDQASRLTPLPAVAAPIGIHDTRAEAVVRLSHKDFALARRDRRTETGAKHFSITGSRGLGRGRAGREEQAKHGQG
jgi:hypothetical protein